MHFVAKFVGHKKLIKHRMQSGDNSWMHWVNALSLRGNALYHKTIQMQCTNV